MKKIVVSTMFLLLLANTALAHSGHAHTYKGTVTMLHGDNAFMMKTTNGKEITVQTTTKTKFMHADHQVAKQSELAAGMRVVVKMSPDGKTATSVKMSAPKKK